MKNKIKELEEHVRILISENASLRQKLTQIQNILNLESIEEYRI